MNYYSVAGVTFSVGLPESVDAGVLLPSFRMFAVKAPARGTDIAFSFNADGAVLPDISGWRIENESSSDMGDVVVLSSGGGEYGVEISGSAGCFSHKMLVSGCFTEFRAEIDWRDRLAGVFVCSMLRIAFSQVILLRKGVSIHASSVVLDDRAFLFLGKSGTGKSTHSALWLKNFPDASLLNDDNPAVRIEDGVPVVYGTPWSGKTPCYKNERYRLAGIARLNQADYNRFTYRQDTEAFLTILPSCSVFRCDGMLRDALYDTVASLAEMIVTGELECLPDDEAAECCLAGFSQCD